MDVTRKTLGLIVQSIVGGNSKSRFLQACLAGTPLSINLAILNAIVTADTDANRSAFIFDHFYAAADSETPEMSPPMTLYHGGQAWFLAKYYHSSLDDAD